MLGTGDAAGSTLTLGVGGVGSDGDGGGLGREAGGRPGLRSVTGETRRVTTGDDERRDSGTAGGPSGAAGGSGFGLGAGLMTDLTTICARGLDGPGDGSVGTIGPPGEGMRMDVGAILAGVGGARGDGFDAFADAGVGGSDGVGSGTTAGSIAAIASTTSAVFVRCRFDAGTSSGDCATDVDATAGASTSIESSPPVVAAAPLSRRSFRFPRDCVSVDVTDAARDCREIGGERNAGGLARLDGWTAGEGGPV